jgi:hypothetical protein
MAKFSIEDLTPVVEGASKEFGVPSEYIWNVIRAENSGSPKGAQSLSAVSDNLTSPKNAKGIMQVTPIALQDVIQSGLVPDSIKHEQMTPQDQIRVGTAYLSKLLKLSDKPEEVYAMYNYGPKARFRMADLPQETQGYLKKTNSSSTETSTGGGGTGTFGRGSVDSSQLVQSLLQSMTSQNQNMGEAKQRVQQTAQLGQETQLQSIAEQRALADGAATLAAQRAEITYSQNKALEKLQQTFGLDQSDVNNEIAKSLAVAETARQGRTAVRAEYDELASTDLLSNPIGYLLAQVKMPAVAARNNALADAEDLALQNIDTRTRQLAAAKATLTANTADTIRDNQFQQAQNDAKLANAKLQQQEGQVQVAQANTEMQLAALENQMGDNVRSTLGTIISLEDQQEARADRKRQRDEILAGKKMREDEDLRLNERLAVVSKSLGLVEPMTVARLKGLTNKKVQEAWANAALSGQYGSDLQESLGFYLGNGARDRIQNTGGASVYSTAQKLAQGGAQTEALAARTLQAKNQGKAPKKEDAVAAGFEMYRDDLVNSMSGVTSPEDLSSSRWNSTYNPYVAPYLSFGKAINENPQLQKVLGNNVVKLAVEDLVKSGAIKTENLTADQQQQVLLSVAEQVKQRKIDPKQAAAQVAMYYKAASAYNSQLNKPELFGLPQQKSYLFTLEGTFGAANRKKLDLMNPTDIENTLIWRAKRGEMQSPFGTGGSSAEEALFVLGGR